MRHDTPVAGGVSIAPVDARPERLTGAARLLSDALGPGSYAATDVAALVADRDYHLLEARLAGHVVGVAGARLTAPGPCEHLTPFGEQALAMCRQQVLGCLDTAAVLRSCRGRGIGTRLASARLDWLRSRGARVVYAISWLSGQAHTSAPVLERLGLERIAVAEAYFRAQSLRRGIGCVVCGHPCVCAYALYVKALEPG